MSSGPIGSASGKAKYKFSKLSRSDQLFIYPRQSHEILLTQLIHSDAFILPYPDGIFFEDRFPLKALEYAALRRPILVSDTVSHRNIFSDGTLQVLTNNLNNNFDIQFIDLIPTSLSTLDFDVTTSETNFLTASVTFTYTYYEIRKPNMGRIVDSAWYTE